jgi:deoxyribodipyrimidine photolyase-like uncharacterized protein
LVLVPGDQLNLESSAIDVVNPAQDVVWMAEMAEMAEESTHIWSSKQRIALFLAAVRHFAQTYHCITPTWTRRITGATCCRTAISSFKQLG